MNYIGIDIGSTASKVIVLDSLKKTIIDKKILPSGWNSKETSETILYWLNSKGYQKSNSYIVATGYGRISVPYADKTVTEITCHAKGVNFLNDMNYTIIDIGGQDTKIIFQNNGKVLDFIMNDKCSAGTGRFLEIMANRLALTLDEMFEYAKLGEGVEISSICTVFAESEIISLMGKGSKKEDIAKGVINSIASKVSTLAARKNKADGYFLSGGFSNNEYMLEVLSKYLKSEVITNENAQFAGAIGAALMGE